MFCRITLAVLLCCASAQGDDFQTVFPRKGTVLWVGAHADDEALMAGALLSELSSNGFRVVVVILTHGSSNGLGKEYDSELARVRRSESQAACQIYGAHGCLTLDFPQPAHYTKDPGGAWKESSGEVLEEWNRLGILETLDGLIAAFNPAVIITLDPDHGMYGHPEHEAAALAAMQAALPRGIEVYAAENRFESILPGNLDPGPVDFQISGDAQCGETTCWQTEYAAILAYRSQAPFPRIDLVPASERYTFLRRLSFSKRRIAAR